MVYSGGFQNIDLGGKNFVILSPLEVPGAYATLKKCNGKPVIISNFSIQQAEQSPKILADYHISETGITGSFITEVSPTNGVTGYTFTVESDDKVTFNKITYKAA